MKRAACRLLVLAFALAMSATAAMAAGKGKAKAPASAPANPSSPAKPAPAIDVALFGTSSDSDYDAVLGGLGVVQPKLAACVAGHVDEAAIEKRVVAVALLTLDAQGKVTGGQVGAGGTAALEKCLLEALRGLPALSTGRGWVEVAFIFQKQVKRDGDGAGGLYATEVQSNLGTEIDFDTATSPLGQSRGLSLRLFEQEEAVDACYQKYVPKKARQPVSFLVDVELAPDGKVTSASVDGTGVQALDACVGLLVKKTVSAKPPPATRVSILVNVRPLKPGAPRKHPAIDRLLIMSDGSWLGYGDRVGALQIAAFRKEDALLGCYVDGLKRDPKLGGVLMLFLAHDATGAFAVPGVGGLGDADVESCVVKVFASLKLPDPLPAGAAIVSMSFTPGTLPP